jgi:hypothetical protein
MRACGDFNSCLATLESKLMARIARSAWVILVGCFVAALGVIAFCFTDAGFFGFATSLGGSLTVLVASIKWARNAVTQYVLRAAVSVGGVSFLFGFLISVNIHGPSAILMFLLPLAVLDSVLLFCIFFGREFRI